MVLAGLQERKKPVVGSYVPMKFGSRSDFRVAVTELEWIKSQKGVILPSDLASVGNKYAFPPDFLEAGLEGLIYPRDDLVSASKWYPIIYSWNVREKLQSDELYRLQIDYRNSKAMSLFLFVMAASAVSYAAAILYVLFNLGLLQVALGIGIPASLALTGVFFQFRGEIQAKLSRLETYMNQLKMEGLDKIIKEHEKVLDDHAMVVSYAGKVMLRKLQEAPLLTAIPLGIEEREVKERKRRFGRVRSTNVVEKEKVPAFWVENPFVEYRRRIRQLFGMDPNKDDLDLEASSAGNDSPE